MEKKIGIKCIGTELFVAVEKDWIQIDAHTKEHITKTMGLRGLLLSKENEVHNIKLEFEKMTVVRQYREVGIEHQKPYERWVTFKAGQCKPFYIKRRELAVFTLPQTQDA